MIASASLGIATTSSPRVFRRRRMSSKEAWRRRPTWRKRKPSWTPPACRTRTSPCSERNSNTPSRFRSESRPRNSVWQQSRSTTSPPAFRLVCLLNYCSGARTAPPQSLDRLGKPAGRHRPRGVFSHRDSWRNRRICRLARFQLVRLAERLLGRRSGLAQTLFDAGRRRATSESARANYDATVATYRQTSPTAFQEVEDNVAALRILENEMQQQQQAVASSQESLQLFTNRYKGGVDTYLQVITAQTIELAGVNQEQETINSADSLEETVRTLLESV